MEAAEILRLRRLYEKGRELIAIAFGVAERALCIKRSSGFNPKDRREGLPKWKHIFFSLDAFKSLKTHFPDVESLPDPFDYEDAINRFVDSYEKRR